MKNKKVLSVVLAASALVLASCGNNGESTSPVGPTSSTSGTSEVQPAVTSVSVKLASAKLGVGETTKATATVKVTNGAAKTVTWSSSDESVATVDSSGNVTAIKIGSATITATSTVDSSKYGSAVVSVVNKGFAPELYDNGFSFTEGWASVVAAAKSFLGSSSVSLPEPDSIADGAYFAEEEESEDYYASFTIIIKDDQEDSYFAKIATEDAYGVYDDYNEAYFVIDETKSFVGYIYATYYSEESEDIVTAIQLYRVDDAYYNDGKTTASAWSATDLAAFAEVELDPLPFVQLGQHYTIEADTEYGMVYIYDNCVDWTLLDGYGTALTDAGYALDEESGYYVKSVDEITQYYVGFSFGSYGNIIEYGVEAKVFSEYPTAYVNNYVSTVLGSKYTVPEILATSAEKQYSCVLDADDEIGEYLGVSIYSIGEDEFFAYEDTFEEAGFEVEEIVDEDEVAYGFAGSKGLIAFEAYYEADYEIDWEALEVVYLETGTASIFIYQGEGYEDPGIYFPKGGYKVRVEEEVQLEPTLFEIEGHTAEDVSYVVKSGSEFASVSATGLVTGIAEGTAVITASIEGTEYTKDVSVVVSDVVEVHDILNRELTGVADKSTSYTSWSGKTSLSDAVYAGQSAGSNNSIQIRSKNANSGIVSTVSGGTLVSVTVSFASANSTKALNIYASNTAYTSPSELFSATPVGTITPVPGGSATYTFTADYAYIGIASSDGAQYLTQVEIVWEA